MFSIGEFSRISGLTVKTLRFYHEQGVLIPSRVDAGSGYRYYDRSKIETARVISALRDLEFSLADISEIVAHHDDDSSILAFLEAHRSEIQERLRKDRRIVRQLDAIISQEKAANVNMSETTYAVEEKTIEPILIAGIRMTGRYSDCAGGFAKLGRAFGRHACGKPMMLHYDNEYRADDANFEVVMPVRKGKSTKAIELRTLPGGPCLSLMHRGPYEELRWSYEKILKHAQDRGIHYQIPTREVYHKGPGMILRGNPKKYLTEIQLMLSDEEQTPASEDS